MITITSVEAQKSLDQWLDAAQCEPITITRRGRPVTRLVALQGCEAGQHRAHAAREAVAAFIGAGEGGTVHSCWWTIGRTRNAKW